MSSKALALTDRIKSFPPLPDSLIKIESVCTDPDSGLLDLVKIVKTDPSLTANILKAANTPYYGFGRKISTIDQAISMFGMAAVRGFALGAAIRRSLSIDLTPYGVSPEEFRKASEMTSALVFKWYPKLGVGACNSVLPAAFISNLGTIVISKHLRDIDEAGRFALELQQTRPADRCELERSICGASSTQICALIFNHWNFDSNLVETIIQSESPQNANPRNNQAWGLKAVNLACGLSAQPLPANLEDACQVIADAGWDIQLFKECFSQVFV